MKYLIITVISLCSLLCLANNKLIATKKNRMPASVEEVQLQLRQERCVGPYRGYCHDTYEISDLTNELLSQLRSRSFGSTEFRIPAALASRFRTPYVIQEETPIECIELASVFGNSNVQRAQELRQIGKNIYDTTIIEAYSARYIQELQNLKTRIEGDLNDNRHCNRDD
jgi:hypothetical protein